MLSLRLACDYPHIGSHGLASFAHHRYSKVLPFGGPKFPFWSAAKKSFALKKSRGPPFPNANVPGAAGLGAATPGASGPERATAKMAKRKYKNFIFEKLFWSMSWKLLKVLNFWQKFWQKKKTHCDLLLCFLHFTMIRNCSWIFFFMKRWKG